jgi:hypothetical protein
VLFPNLIGWVCIRLFIYIYLSIQVSIAYDILFFCLFIALLIKTKLPIVILKNGTIRSYICRNESHRHPQPLHCFEYPWVSAKTRPLIEINMTQVLLVLDTTLFITDASTTTNLWIKMALKMLLKTVKKLIGTSFMKTIMPLLMFLHGFGIKTSLKSILMPRSS